MQSRPSRCFFRYFTLVFSCLVFSSTFASSAANAGESYFSRVYTTETVPAGSFELEQVVRNRSGRSFGHYSAFDLKSEFEYGISDDLQGSFYVNTLYLNSRGAPDDDDSAGQRATGFTRRGFYLTSLSAEFIYRTLSPVKDAIGLAFYFEPEFSFHDHHNGMRYDNTFGTDFRVLLQKNFLDNTLVLAYNAVFEVEFIRFKGQEGWAGELEFNNELGLSYRVAPNWFAGLEFRNHNELGDFKVHEHSVYWAGPVLHYGGQNVWATLGTLYQFYGRPNGRDSETGLPIGSSRFLRSHERWETTLKVGFPF